MEALQAQVIANNCSKCRDQLLVECNRLKLPPPITEFIWVPKRWASHKCTHIENGLVLKFKNPVTNGVQPDPTGPNDPADGTDITQQVERWDRHDASKGIGYPCREEGSYGSYPSHDGFDDESEP